MLCVSSSPKRRRVKSEDAVVVIDPIIVLDEVIITPVVKIVNMSSPTQV